MISFLPFLRGFLLLAAVATSSWFFSCSKDEPVSPPVEPEDTTTTSHDFRFTAYVLGDGASRLRNVAIVNDTLAYAVGEINVKDSAGDYVRPPYNLARWDGKTWHLERVWFVYEPDVPGVGESVGILAFSGNDLIVSSGGVVMHWNGTDWSKLGHLYGSGWSIGSAQYLWGRSSNDFYGVGGYGSIVRWNGTKWEKIDSGTNLSMQDIWGAANVKTGKDEVVCLASERYNTVGKRIIMIKGGMTTVQDSTGLATQLSGLWFVAARKYYAVGTGICWKSDIEDHTPWFRYAPHEVTNYGSECIRGNGTNDVVVAGSYGELAHYNGKSWHNYTHLVGLTDIYYKIAFRRNMIIAVGTRGQKAVALVGVR